MIEVPAIVLMIIGVIVTVMSVIILKLNKQHGKEISRNVFLTNAIENLKVERYNLQVELRFLSNEKFVLLADPRALPIGTEVIFQGKEYLTRDDGSLDRPNDYLSYSPGRKVTVHTTFEELASLTLTRKDMTAILRDKCLEELDKIDTATLLDLLEECDDEVLGNEDDA